jgi:CheY-like chemotaxis protein
MNRQGRVLIVDDLEKWRKELVSILQREGYATVSADTAASAFAHLQTEIYHVAVLDIRLVDLDQNNTDGIDLLRDLGKRGLHEATRIIILSAYGTQEHMREAFKDYRVADFLSKNHFTRKGFLESVHHVFLNEALINLKLDIHWQQVRGPEQVVYNLELGGIRLRRNADLQNQIALELDDLLCRLFYTAESVMLRPFPTGPSGTGVLWAQPFYPNGGGRAVVVTFGDVQRIEQEADHFRKYVQPFVSGGRATSILAQRRTPHLGGITYSLLGADKDQWEDFGAYYRHASTQQIMAVLDHLFLDTCGAWYANPGQLQPYDLTSGYQRTLGFTQENLDAALLNLQKSVKGRQKLSFTGLHQERLFTNPLLKVEERSLMRSTYSCITHGDFNQHNILIDSSGHSWLIDFQATSPGHVLRDVAQLDSEIRFGLLAAHEASLDEILHMEEVLCQANLFSEIPQLATQLTSLNQTLTKVCTVIVHLRALARKLIAQKPDDDVSEYYIALFYYAINTLRFYTVPSPQREHALICASLLADRLK